MAAANRDGYDRIIVITDGQWHYSDTTTVQGYGGCDPHVVAPAPLTKQAYMINVASYKNGVGYGKWMNIDGPERFCHRVHPRARTNDVGQLNSQAWYRTGPAVSRKTQDSEGA